MAAPPVPSSSNNWPRGWISRSNSSQNFALMVDTCAPESTKAVTSHPSTTTGASLARPTNRATGSGFRNGIGSMVFPPLLFICLFLGRLWLGVTEGMLGLHYVRLDGGLTAFPWVPPSLFNGATGVAHSLAIWPQP